MSTVYTPAEPPEPVAPAEPEALDAPEAKRTLLQRVPTPLFVVGYGALIVAVVVFVAMLASYEPGGQASNGASTALTSQVRDEGGASTSNGPEKLLPFNPAEPDPRNVRESVRSYLITDLETGSTHTGTSARGTLTKVAMQSPAELSGHISRLLEQNCLDKLELVTPDNMRVLLLGFCFSTLPPTTIATALTTADELEADSVKLTAYHPSLGTEMSMKWLDVPSMAKLEALRDEWGDIDFPEGVNRLQFSAWGPDATYVMDYEEGKDPWYMEGPTGDAFDEKYGIPR